MASPTKLQSGSQSLTKSSWDPGQLTSIRRVAARDQLPRRDTWHTWDVATHPGNWVAETGEVIKCTAPEECALTKHLVTWAVWTWERHETQTQLNLCLCGVPENLNLSGVDMGSARNPGPFIEVSQQSNLECKQCRPGKHTRREWGQTQCDPDTPSTPYTCQ